MASLYNADLKPLAYGTKTHSYDHATKLFVADNMRLMPKQKFLYYVVINIDVGIIQNLLTSSQSISDPISSQDLIQQYEAGLMAKRVELPKFTMNTKTLNAYNRKNIVQTHITYDPISITFHDDAADIITNLWNDYYTYYYRDSDYDPTLYQLPHKYQPRNAEKWGFSPRNSNLKPFLRSIQIYSLHQKRFTEYTLVNPMISSWRHGEHDAYAGNEPMDATMTLAYETVKYKTGYVNAVDVNGFSILHYDNFQSPISTSTTNIFTDSGIIGAAEGAAKDLARPDGKSGSADILSNVLSAYRFYNGVKNANFGSVLSTTIGQIGTKIINNAINGVIGGAVFPTLGGLGSGVYGSSQVYSNAGISQYSPYGSPSNNIGVTIAGQAAGIVTGAAVNVSNQLTSQFVNDLTRGVSVQGGVLAAPTQSPIYDQRQTSRFVQLDQYGNPIAGQGTNTSFVTNSQGGIVAPQVAGATVTGKLAGDYDPLDPAKNLVSTESTTSSTGTTTTTVTYSGGTRVTREIYPDGTSKELQIVPAAPTNQIINPNNNTPQVATNLYRDNRTGLIYDKSGTLGAQLQNSVSQTAGTVAGLYAGQELNSALNSTALGKTVLGRTVAAATSTVVGAQIGIWTNNGAQLILNKASGYATQAFDSASGAIKDVVGNWFGSGGYNANKPQDNVVAATVDSNGSNVYTYKDGTTRTVDAEGVQTITKPESSASAWNISSWGFGPPGTNSDSSVLQPTGSTFTDRWGNPVMTGYGGEWNAFNVNNVSDQQTRDALLGKGDPYVPDNPAEVDAQLANWAKDPIPLSQQQQLTYGEDLPADYFGP